MFYDNAAFELSFEKFILNQRNVLKKILLN